MPGVWISQAERLLSVLRIMTALLFFVHGSMKMFHFPPSDAFPAIEPFTQIWFAGILEVVGGPLLALGLFTRPVAFILAGEMAVAYFLAHAPQGFYPLLNGGESAVLFCFIFLYLSAAGGGAWSLDRLLFVRKIDS